MKVRVNGEVQDLVSGMKLDRYKTHDIEIVVDRMLIEDTEDKDKEFSLVKGLIIAVISGILSSFFSSLISFLLYCSVALMWIIPDRRIEKRIIANNEIE